MPSIMDFVNSSTPDTAVRDATKTEMERLRAELDRSIAQLTKETVKFNQGKRQDTEKMLEVIQLTNKTIEGFNKLSKSTEKWSGSMFDDIKFEFSNLEKRYQSYVAFYLQQQDKMQQKEMARLQAEARERAQREKDQERRAQRFYAKNADMLAQIDEDARNMSGDIEKVLSQMDSINQDYIEHAGVRADMDRALFKLHQNSLDDLIEKYESAFDEIKDIVDDETKEIFQDNLEEWKKQAALNRQYYQSEMRSNQSLMSQMFGSVVENISDIELGFDTIKSIFDSINIHQITQALTGNSEQLIDVYSEVARQRGIAYDYVKELQDTFKPDDTYGGMIGSEEIMNVYRMNNLNSDYLAEIASATAMFEKETGVSNENLNDILLWAQNSGVSRTRIVEMLDHLQSLRDDGAKIESILAFQSENAALLGNKAEEFYNMEAGLQSLQIDTTDLRGAIASGNTIIGGNNKDLRSMFAMAGLLQQAEEAINNRNYEELGKLYGQALQATGERFGGNNITEAVMSEKLGVAANTIEMFDQTNEKYLTSQDIEDAINAAISDQSTIEDNADSAGFVSQYDQNMNQASTTWVEDWFTRFSEFTKDHTIVTSLAGEAVQGLVSGVTSVAGTAFLGWLTKGKAGKIFGKFAQHADDIGDAAKAMDKAADAMDAARAADNVADAAKAMDNIKDAADVAKTADTAKGFSKLFEGVNVVDSMKDVSKTIKESDNIVDAMKGLKAAPGGAIIGDVLLDTALGAAIWGLSDNEMDKSKAAGSTVGSVIGDVAGWALGGPLGALGLGFVGDQLGERVGYQSQWAKDNYGSVFAADWNPLSSLWRKDGTLSQQLMNGTIADNHPEMLSGITDENGKELTYGELKKIEQQNAALSEQWSVDNAENVEAFKRALYNSVDKNGEVDLSFMNGVDAATAKMLFESVFGTDVFTSGKLRGMQYMMSPGQTLSDVTFGNNEDEWYSNQLENSSIFEDFLDENKDLADVNSALEESVTGLTNEVSEMRSWLETKGIYGTAVWADETVRSKYYEMNTVTVASNQDGSHESGLSYVPYDNYVAELHKGERVLTASENSQYEEQTIDGGKIHSDMAEILSALDNKELQKIIKDGFEFIGKKITEASDKSKRYEGAIASSTKKSLTSMFLSNQWG